ncbi:required for excision 1-B domain-containing protein [Alligator mississippiensis]|uniref:required for excision 1-B domain-containing protein n=1 Tax=Alligator mississippiensis TaxID=8496 RepID=UPI0028778B0F|nr:required for excision 1-B domain-containing protein [Alligator mississippiensis]
MTDDDVQALLRRFYALQGERVEAYRLFEEGHQAYLSSGPHYDFLRYRQLVHEITLAFSGISREILQIKGRLEEQHGRPELAQHLARVQQKEQEKLELTAQLQLAKQNAQDQPGVEAHQQEVRELKHKLIKTIEAISEILQDLKYDSEEAE